MVSNRLQRVWIVDDSDIDLFLQKRLMELTQFASEIVMHKSPVIALQELAASPPARWPDVIFLDLNMPVINGIQFLEQMQVLRLQVGEEACRVIMVTSSTNFQDCRSAKAFPFVTEFISKPLTQPLLVDLQRVLVPVR
jgi:two-component system nitrate/nitrite response regulator NarL